jgi:hypothetical protein
MWNFFIKALLILLSPFALMYVIMAITFIGYSLKGYKLPKSNSTYKPRGILRRLLIDFPCQFWKDKFNRDPNGFNEYGVHLFCGEQGSGKTTAVVDLLIKLKKKYPLLKIRTNFSYANQDDEVYDWKDLCKNENGIYGQVEVIDEIQTWFSSSQSKDFPPQMLQEVSQQRKQRKMIVGTAQIFGRIGKPIREQTTYVYCPMTIFGCITIVRVSKPHYYDDETYKFKRYIRRYFFIHDDAIRNAFDTYKKIEGMVRSGFTLRPDLKDD